MYEVRGGGSGEAGGGRRREWRELRTGQRVANGARAGGRRPKGARQRGASQKLFEKGKVCPGGSLSTRTENVIADTVSNAH